MSRAHRLIAALLAEAILVAAPVAASTLFDPALRFRELPTEHFVIYFHQGEERLARHLAAIADDTWRALRPPLGVVPPPLTRVVVAGQTDLWHGYATPLPPARIVIHPAWPPATALS